MTVFDLLRADHRQLTQLFEQVRQTEDEFEKRALFEEIRDRLEAHSEIEEEVLYPAFSRVVDLQELMSESTEDHRLMREILAELSKEYHREDFEDLLDELIDMVEDHVDEEELEVFPRLVSALREDEWQELYGQMMQRRSEKTAAAA